MYIINTEIEVNWLIPATVNTYLYTDFDVVIRQPDGINDYYEAAIAEADYIAPTDSTNGGASFKITPDKLGVWVVVLSVGNSALSDIYWECHLQVHINDTHVYQQY